MTRLGILPPEPERWPRTMGLALFGVLACLACLRYLALSTHVHDLGLTMRDLTAIGSGGQWWRAMNGHIQPVLWLYAWLADPLPEWLAPLGLLVAQTFMLALPLPALARRYGAFAALAYFAFFAVWRTGLFDFHTDHLAVPLGFCFFFAAQDARPWRAAFFALCLCMIREPYAAQAAACGIYLAFQRRGAVAGLVTFALGMSWFWVATAKLVPFFSTESAAALAAAPYAWIEGGSVLGKVWHVVTHPFSVAAQVLCDPSRLRYMLALLGTVGFLPLLNPGPLLTGLPVFALALLSGRPEDYSLNSQFSAGMIAPIIVAFAGALPLAADIVESRRGRVDRWAGALLLVLAGGHVLFSASPVSLAFHTQGGFGAYWPGERDKRIIRAMETILPGDQTVPVVTQNSLNWGKAVTRDFSQAFPVAVFEPYREQNPTGASFADFRRFVLHGEKPSFPLSETLAEYVTLDLKRPWFVGGAGCAWDGQRCTDEAVAVAFMRDVDRARELFETIHEDDGFLILKRRKPAAPAAPEAPAVPELPAAPPEAEGQAGPESAGQAAPGADQPAASPPASAKPGQPG